MLEDKTSISTVSWGFVYGFCDFLWSGFAGMAVDSVVESLIAQEQL